MFFVDEPYVSEFFKATVRDHGIPVVGTPVAGKLDLLTGTNIITEAGAVEMVRASAAPLIYLTSENSIGWISERLPFSDLSEKIALFKNKLKFRQLTESISPDFYFREVCAEELETIRFDEIPLPFIIKPTVGFFSIGVHQVSSQAEWISAIEAIAVEMEIASDLFPEVVLDTDSFIIEQYIPGEEYAVDAYYDSNGKPVILSILKHAFSSDSDVGDRVYTTSSEIIEDNLQEFSEFLAKIGELAGVKTFPLHVELRRDSNGSLMPIELNPMRFGGWCTTADLSFLAYGFNPYLYYYLQLKPDWGALLKGKEGKLFNLIVLDNTTGIDTDRINSFDYDQLLANFAKPLELRKIDHKKHNFFGFLFVETSVDNSCELDNILHSDLSEFVETA
jgi:hypothetical protein